MTIAKKLTFSVLVLTGILGYTVFSTASQQSDASSNQQATTRQAAPQQRQREFEYEYATMTSQAIQENNGMVYTVTWNAGVQDITGRSTLSLQDAMRRLSALLGGANNARANLSTVLNSVGRDRWRLVESNRNDFGMTRIFIRVEE